MTQRAALRVGPTATTLRRDLGPTAWTVLEELVAVARQVEPDAAVAQVSVRQLADVLGLACGTVGRALRTLRTAGLALPMQSRGRDGVFTRGSYALTVPPHALSCTEPSAPLPAAARARRSPAVRTEQLALLPE